MTGPLEWLSQSPLENRKANRLLALTAPRAIRRLQTAERGLLRASAATDLAHRRDSIGGHFTALRSAAEQQIIAHIRGKMALIDPTLSTDARHAAIQRLLAEQEATLAHLRQDIRQARLTARRTVTKTANRGYAARRTWLLIRHKTEHAACLALFGVRRGNPAKARPRWHLKRTFIRSPRTLALQRRPGPGRRS